MRGCFPRKESLPFFKIKVRSLPESEANAFKERKQHEFFESKKAKIIKIDQMVSFCKEKREQLKKRENSKAKRNHKLPLLDNFMLFCNAERERSKCLM